MLMVLDKSNKFKGLETSVSDPFLRLESQDTESLITKSWKEGWAVLCPNSSWRSPVG